VVILTIVSGVAAVELCKCSQTLPKDLENERSAVSQACLRVRKPQGSFTPDLLRSVAVLCGTGTQCVRCEVTFSHDTMGKWRDRASQWRH